MADCVVFQFIGIIKMTGMQQNVYKVLYEYSIFTLKNFVLLSSSSTTVHSLYKAVLEIEVAFS